jgi:hypothetical protein
VGIDASSALKSCALMIPYFIESPPLSMRRTCDGGGVARTFAEDFVGEGATAASFFFALFFVGDLDARFTLLVAGLLAADADDFASAGTAVVAFLVASLAVMVEM